jgi:hypothetical protein
VTVLLKSTPCQSPSGGYLAQPDMRRLIGTALELGWSPRACEAVREPAPDTGPAERLTMEHTSWREREQAVNLCRLTAPDQPARCWPGAVTATPAR